MPPRWQIGPPKRKLTQPILPPRRRRLVVLVSDLGTPCFLLDPWNLFLFVSNLLDEEESVVWTSLGPLHGGYQDRLLGGPLGLPGLRYTAPEGVEHKDYTGVVLG
jgi:hypothetical protein